MRGPYYVAPIRYWFRVGWGVYKQLVRNDGKLMYEPIRVFWWGGPFGSRLRARQFCRRWIRRIYEESQARSKRVQEGQPHS